MKLVRFSNIWAYWSPGKIHVIYDPGGFIPSGRIGDSGMGEHWKTVVVPEEWTLHSKK